MIGKAADSSNSDKVIIFTKNSGNTVFKHSNNILSLLCLKANKIFNIGFQIQCGIEAVHQRTRLVL